MPDRYHQITEFLILTAHSSEDVLMRSTEYPSKESGDQSEHVAPVIYPLRSFGFFVLTRDWYRWSWISNGWSWISKGPFDGDWISEQNSPLSPFSDLTPQPLAVLNPGHQASFLYRENWPHRYSLLGSKLIAIKSSEVIIPATLVCSSYLWQLRTISPCVLTPVLGRL